MTANFNGAALPADQFIAAIWQDGAATCVKGASNSRTLGASR